MSSSSRPKSSTRAIDSESRKPKLAKRPASTMHDDIPSDDLESNGSEQHDVENQMDVEFIDSTVANPRVQLRTVPRQARPMQIRMERDPRPSDPASHVSPSMLLLLGSTLHSQGNMIVYPDTSGYIPDFHAFFHCLYAMQTLVYDNENFISLAHGYLSLTTTIYYSVLLLFQIARTRTILGVASRSESQFARRFEREFPLESLPIAGPLAGFFEVLGSITSLQGYGSVVPDFIDFNQFTTVGSFIATINGKCRFPPIPMMIKLWNDLRTGTNIRTRPHELLFWTASQTKLGVSFADPTAYGSVAISPGWTEPLSNITVAADYVTLKTRLKRMLPPPDMSTLTYNTVGNFCGLSDTTPWKWFNGFKHFASIEATFFEGETNMSTISTYGTLGFLVETQISKSFTPIAYANPETIDTPFYPCEQLLTADDISALSRLGDEHDFRLGIATSYCTHYQSIPDVSFRRRRHGPWFDERTSVVSTDDPSLSSAVPFVREIWNVPNPCGQFSNVLHLQMFRVQGQNPNKR